jgi:uncharacterized protein YyaL (SSP411 family)
MRHGKISAPGLLEDQAAMIRAALALYQATGAATRLAQALRILEATEQNFADGEGAFFMSAADATDIFAPRSRHVQDGPTPSGIGLMAENYAVLYQLTGEAKYRAGAETLLAAYGGKPERLGGAPVLLAAADTLENATCVVVTGNAAALAAAALAAPDPAIVVLALKGMETMPPSHPAYGKTTTAAAAYICRGGTCSLPVTTPDALRALLRQGPAL